MTLEEKIQAIMEGKKPVDDQEQNQPDANGVIPATVTSDGVENPATNSLINTPENPVVTDATQTQPDAGVADLNAPVALGQEQEEPPVSIDNPLSVGPLVKQEDETGEDENKVDPNLVKEETLTEMAIDTVKHPLHGDLAWHDLGQERHAIAKNGKMVFSGTRQEVADKWAAIKKSINESTELEESILQLFVIAESSVGSHVSTAYSWHGGQNSALYSFASTGGIVHNEGHRNSLIGEINGNLHTIEKNPTVKEYQGEAEKLNALKDFIKTAPTKIAESAETLIAADANLTEEFQAKAKELFEARLAEATAEMQKEFESKLAEATQKLEEEKQDFIMNMSEKIDTYLDAQSEKWVVENKSAVEATAKYQLMESFMGGIKSLYESHGMVVPEGKIDLVEDLQKQVSDLTSIVEESNEKIKKLTAEQIFAESAKGMTDLDQARLMKLTEDVEFCDADEYRARINVIKEQFFSKRDTVSKNLTEDKLNMSSAPILESNSIDTPNNPNMQRYIDFINRHSGSK